MSEKIEITQKDIDDQLKDPVAIAHAYSKGHNKTFKVAIKNGIISYQVYQGRLLMSETANSAIAIIIYNQLG
jgi:hypothetical protein